MESQSPKWFSYYTKKAFTLAEILIVLGIIGVVAAMTISTLIQNSKNAEVEVKLKKIYSTMNQAILLSEVDNGSRMDWNFSCTKDEEEGVKNDCSVFPKPTFCHILNIQK